MKTALSLASAVLAVLTAISAPLRKAELPPAHRAPSLNDVPRTLLSRPAPPPGWRYPTLSEIAPQWRDQDPGRFLWISADFDGDGVTDSAMLLVRTQTPEVGLVVVLGRSPGKAITLEVPQGAAGLDVMGIKIVPAGQYKTACGKGYVECTQDEPGVLALQDPAIDFWKYSTNFVFYFDRQKGSFRRVWTSY